MKHKIVFMVLAMLTITAFLVPREVEAQQSGQSLTFLPGLRPLTHADSVWLNDNFRGFFSNGADFENLVGKIWLMNCRERDHHRYPDSNFVPIGDTLYFPLGYAMVVGPNMLVTADCRYQASRFFAEFVVADYLASVYGRGQFDPNPAKKDTTSYTMLPSLPPVKGGSEDLWNALKVLGVIALIMLLFYLLFIRKEPAVKAPTPEQPTQTPPPPFVTNPPMPDTPPAEVERSIHEAFGQVYGERNFTVVPGSIHLCRATGKQLVQLWADGVKQTTEYKNELAYRADLRFKNGKVYRVVCRQSCMNPLWNVAGVQNFEGTLVDVESNTASVIPAICPAELAVAAISVKQVAKGKEAASIELMMPASAEVRHTDSESEVQPAEEKMHFTKVQVSNEKGLNLEGEFDLTVNDLRGIIAQVTGKEETKKS